MTTTKAFVCILMGSATDEIIVSHCFPLLRQFGIPFEARICSAHRSPQFMQEVVISATNRGCQVFIAAAGLAAHLAGSVAAHTHRPVIGIPLNSGDLGGMDALLSTVQMPGGIPVACMAVGKPGAKNAALLAAQILALHDPTIDQNLKQHRTEQAQALRDKSPCIALSETE